MKLPMPFNNPHTYKGHSGVDFPQKLGTVVKASGNGKIANKTRNSRGGNTLWVQYDNGTRAGYAHLPDNFPGSPAIGTRVKEGDRIGKVGLTGNTTGPHLHVEVSGDATTDGFYRHFDKGRTVGSGSSSGSGVKAPAFPLPSGWYFGPKSGPQNSVSGFFSHREDLRRFQKRMAERGWKIDADGLYGDKTRRIVKAFQKEKGLKVDGLIGPATWRAAWESPIT